MNVQDTRVSSALDGDECPICRGWNCTRENPHFAWVLGAPANALARARRAETEAFRVRRDAGERGRS